METLLRLTAEYQESLIWTAGMLIWWLTGFRAVVRSSTRKYDMTVSMLPLALLAAFGGFIIWIIVWFGDNRERVIFKKR